MNDADAPDRDVILVTVDSLRHDYVFDSTGVFEPLDTLRSLADSGTAFSTAFSNATYTKSSFLSIFSGTYPWMFESVQGGYGPDRPHVAELFSDAGYETGGFHSNPYLDPAYGYDRGFDYYMGRDTSEDIDRATISSNVWQFITGKIGSARLSKFIRDSYRSIGATLGVQLAGDPYLDAEIINDTAVEWAKRTDGPRFMWVHYMDVHTPYYPHKGTVSEGINKREAVKLFHRVDGQRNQASEHDLELLRRLYRGELEYLDDRLGDLFDRLEDHIDIDESIVAFSSDHGEAFNEHGHVFHPDGVLYDELVHIPLLVSGPEFESANVDTPVSNVDLVPTLLAAADITVPNDCVGRDLADVAAELPDRYAFSEGWTEDDGRAMVSSGEYKLILDLEEGWTRLFNRVDDPVEQTDISAENPTVRNQLHAVLDDHVKMTRNHTGEGRDVDVDDDVKDRLRRLGYAE